MTDERSCAFDYCKYRQSGTEGSSTTAASTISTTKQVEVVREPLGFDLLDLRPWAFNESVAWASAESVHESAYGTGRSVSASPGNWPKARGIMIVRKMEFGYRQCGVSYGRHASTPHR